MQNSLQSKTKPRTFDLKKHKFTGLSITKSKKLTNKKLPIVIKC